MECMRRSQHGRHVVSVLYQGAPMDHHQQMADDRIMENRRRNLRVLAEQWGGVNGLAKKLGYSGGSYISQMTSGYRPITEKTARRIEKDLRIRPSGWMDEPHDLPIAPAQIDEAVLIQIMRSVASVMDEVGISANISTQQRIVELVYENAKSTGRIDDEFIRRVVDLLKQ
jgi:plasmid maintenance system antidote protein VapI